MTGGLEATFCSDLYKMYEKVCSKMENWNCQSFKKWMRWFKEIIFSVSGDDIYSYLKYESCTSVQRVPDTETQGRVLTSVTVAVLPEAEELDINIKDSDLRIDVFRHRPRWPICEYNWYGELPLPSGVVVSQQDEKSQHKNKAKALKILRTRVWGWKTKRSERSK